MGRRSRGLCPPGMQTLARTPFDEKQALVADVRRALHRDLVRAHREQHGLLARPRAAHRDVAEADLATADGRDRGHHRGLRRQGLVRDRDPEVEQHAVDAVEVLVAEVAAQLAELVHEDVAADLRAPL